MSFRFFGFDNLTASAYFFGNKLVVLARRACPTKSVSSLGRQGVSLLAKEMNLGAQTNEDFWPARYREGNV